MDAMDTQLNDPTPEENEVFSRIRKTFAECLQLNVPEHELTGITRLSEIAGLDSMAAVTFVAAIEQEFQLVIEPQYLSLSFLDNVPRLAQYLQARAHL